MKRIACATLLLLSLSCLTVLRPGAAQTAGASASGTYKFILESSFVKYVEFSARTDDKGLTSGTMTFSDEAKISDRDVEDPEDQGSGDPAPFYMKADLDILTVEKNRALMSGIIIDSSLRGYIGRWVQLVVEDGGTSGETPDRLTWRFCRPEQGGWIPSDAEVPGDDGAWLSWWATDAERKDDVGIPSKSLIPDEKRRCEVFPFAVYPFEEPKRWEGDIVVRP
jgi:hypothetical protein